MQRDLIRQIDAVHSKRPVIKGVIYLALVGAFGFMNYELWSRFAARPVFAQSPGFETLLVFIYFAMYGWAPLLFLGGALKSHLHSTYHNATASPPHHPVYHTYNPPPHELITTTHPSFL